MKPYKFRQLIWECNAALDTGKYDDLTIEDTKRSIRNGQVRELFERFGRDVDISMIDEKDWQDLAEEWVDFENKIDEGRKMGIENRGLCLLLAYALQSVQQRIINDTRGRT